MFRWLTIAVSYTTATASSFKAKDIPEGAPDGLRTLLDVVKAAHERASGDVARHMNLPRYRNHKFSMVRYLQANDADHFNGGEWFNNSRYKSATSPKGFDKLIEVVETAEAKDGGIDDIVPHTS